MMAVRMESESLIFWFANRLGLQNKNCVIIWRFNPTQPAIICLKLTIETLEQGVKYVQS